jgi:DNA-binding XRE family transcriptional regulator/predicted RNase H-like HicB family nuclease
VTVRYAAVVRKEKRALLAEFPDCPGCQTFAERGQDMAVMAGEALEGWLEAHLSEGEVPPRPSARAPKAPHGAEVLWVEVPARLAIKLYLRWARQEAGLTQAELARRAGISQQMISRLEDPDHNPTLETLEKVARALGVRLRVSLERA